MKNEGCIELMTTSTPIYEHGSILIVVVDILVYMIMEILSLLYFLHKKVTSGRDADEAYGRFM